VTPRIDIHPELKELLEKWRADHPRGQHVLCLDGSTDPQLLLLCDCGGSNGLRQYVFKDPFSRVGGRFRLNNPAA
jgi:hypothetical protein